MNKKIMLMLHRMAGGGAERVMTLLANWLSACGNSVTLVLVDQKSEDAIKYNISSDVDVVFLKDSVSSNRTYISKSKSDFYRLSSRLAAKFSKILKRPLSEKTVYKRYISKFSDEINELDELVKAKKPDAMVAFLNNPIHLSLLMKEKYPDIRLIISERNDPKIHENSKSATLFINNYYALADAIVFQSGGAKSGFREELQKKGKIIPNPLTANLPDRFVGERKHRIVNFCRISNQKNLPMLIDAFVQFHKKHPDYCLDIIGDATNEEGREVLKVITNAIEKNSLAQFVNIEPFDPNLHSRILDYAMFVSSSDYEGMSNSMLEAMAIGLPSVCTDCPAGGAREIIDDHINGLLTPVNNATALCKAMEEVAENKELSEKLSINAVKLKDDLSVDKIMNEWWSIIDA